MSTIETIRRKIATTLPIPDQGHKAYSYLRSAAFLGEFHLLQNFSGAFRPWVDVPRLKLTKPMREFMLKDIDALYQDDADLFQSGVCPWSLLVPESPVRHVRRLGNILWSAVKMSHLRKKKTTKPETRDPALPDYFQRHFHWQEDGYLTRSSAERYEHQVEILFNGTAAAMRRLMMSPLAEFLANKPTARMLEIGAGTGASARMVHATFPQHSLTVTDLSLPYLEISQEKLPGVTHEQAQAEKLQYADASFDVVYAVFLLHELPREVRMQALKEMLRVLKPGGLLLIVESIQFGDVPKYDKALKKFPQDYHEPFFKDYASRDLKEVFQEFGLTAESKRGFFSKCVWATRPA